MGGPVGVSRSHPMSIKSCPKLANLFSKNYKAVFSIKIETFDYFSKIAQTRKAEN